MNELTVKEILRDQMKLLMIVSRKETCSPSDLCALTDRIIKLCRMNAHEIKFAPLE